VNPSQAISAALQEDIGTADHSSISCIPDQAVSAASVVAKQSGVISGTAYFKEVFRQVNPKVNVTGFFSDGDRVTTGDKVFAISGHARSILGAERVALNILQRMSGISTLTATYVKELEGTRTRLLDTRKTTPNFRIFEKEAVKAGGGHNHRMGLYDMIMLKDNHIDFAGGVEKAILLANEYRSGLPIPLAIEVECRNLEELEKILQTGGVDRIMLDNFTPALLAKAVTRINGKFETEASGGITLATLREFALTGVDFISVGALTHSYSSLDFSLRSE
jgi:nicotinate-nucleotide pyrophosphorylase (carboxylating)